VKIPGLRTPASLPFAYPRNGSGDQIFTFFEVKMWILTRATSFDASVGVPPGVSRAANKPWKDAFMEEWRIKTFETFTKALK
jgi:hypothetical protein